MLDLEEWLRWAATLPPMTKSPIADWREIDQLQQNQTTPVEE
jgi:hypothetical protein